VLRCLICDRLEQGQCYSAEDEHTPQNRREDMRAAQVARCVADVIRAQADRLGPDYADLFRERADAWETWAREVDPRPKHGSPARARGDHLRVVRAKPPVINSTDAGA
jgi:hypothetical protein